MSVLATFSLTDRTAIVTGASEADAHGAQSGAPASITATPCHTDQRPDEFWRHAEPTSGPIDRIGVSRGAEQA